MHSIKKAARRSAWYRSEEDGDTKTYNPFGRVQPRTSYHAKKDIENQLTLVNSENNARSPIEKQRNDFAEAENAPFRGPPKPSTWSNSAPRVTNRGGGATNTATTLRGAEDFEKGSDERSDPSEIIGDDNEKFATPSEEIPPTITDISAGPTDGDGKPRKRRGRKFLSKFGLKKDNADESSSGPKEKKKGPKRNPNITIWSQIRTVFGSWINVLLIAVPIGIAFGNIPDFNYIAVFVVNFIAIVPLAAMLSYATEEYALYIGETLGGLLNASFGNAVELIVAIIALTKGEVLIVQTSLVGSMLSNLLLVMGMCFFFGGINRPKQHFNITVAQTAASLLAISIGSLIIPTTFSIVIPGNADDGLTPLSRGTAVLLLGVYACYLIFQLRTHADVYNEPSQKVPRKNEDERKRQEAEKKRHQKKKDGDVFKGLAAIGAGTGAAASGGSVNQTNLMKQREREEGQISDDDNNDDDDGEVPQLTRLGALLTLAISTVFVALCAEYMVSAINALSQNISKEFIGLILLPIVGNAAEHATAVTVAIKDKMDLSIGVAVGSSLQISLLVFPLMIMLNWFGVGAPADLNLFLDGFLVAVLFIAIILVNYLIADGESHWLEGVLLQVLYIIIAIAAWFYPQSGNVAG